jgi:hypothetical protein
VEGGKRKKPPPINMTTDNSKRRLKAIEAKALSKRRQANGRRLEVRGKHESDCSRAVGGPSMCQPPYIGHGWLFRLPRPNGHDHPCNRPASQDSTVTFARIRWSQSKHNQSARDTSQGQWSDPTGPGGRGGNNAPMKASAHRNRDKFLRS